MDATVSCASPRRHDCPRFGRKAVNPFASSDGLSRRFVRPERSPVAFLLIMFVRYRSFDDKNKRLFRAAFRRAMEVRHKLVAVFSGEERVIQPNFGNPGQSP